MISNTSSSGLQIVDKVDLPYVELHPKIEFSNSYGNNNNNDNKMSSFERMKPFTYYTSGISGVSAHDSGPIATQQCSSAEIVNNSNSLVNNKRTANLNGSNQCVTTYEPCSLNTSKQEELTKKIIDNFRNDNGKNIIKSGGSGVVTFTSVNHKTPSDTSSSCSNSNSSNSSSRSSKSDRQKSPMCRTEDQENAFRQIKVVHNYSKSNRYEYCNGGDSHVANLYSSNSSNQDEDEDDEDDDDDEELEDEVDYEHHLNAKVRTLIAIERQKSKVKQSIEVGHDAKAPEAKIPMVINVEEKEIKPLPDHHARRPMNAFLIFCKRHRGIVKEKYKNFENRSITKILGEWWASLDLNDKTPYVNLAKQNKDAFFSANPNFKWYKLPAPSLRTLNTRPGNTERPLSIPSVYQYELNDSRLQEPLAYSPRSRYEPKREYFKLADEAQMGELNNLMRPLGVPSSGDSLQDTLGETSDYINSVCKRKNNSPVDTQTKVKRLNNDNSFSSSEEDILPKKSSRSCKGKKYQELMNSGQITPVTPKKQLPSKSCPMVNTSEDNQQQFMEYNDRSKTPPTFNGESALAKQCAQLKDVKEEYDYSECCGSPVKQRFGYVSFDLDDKIKALPAQCLETYLQRKKNTKRKKKINSKKRNPPPKSPLPAKGVTQTQLQQVKTAQEAREHMVGSQKRKARKESITRRDINSIQNEVQLILCTGANESNILISGASLSETLPVVNQNSTSDLLILAEVAASHTGIAKI